MKNLFNFEIDAAKTVIFLRSDAFLLASLFVFLLYTTPATALQASKVISKAYKEAFEVLIVFKLIKQESIAIISVAMGLALAILVETAGAAFAVRGKHYIGLIFTGMSSLSALVTMMHSFHYTDENAISDGLFAVFITGAPVMITFFIGRDLASRSNSTQESLLATYSAAVYERMTAGVKSTISKFKI